jgi:predicted PurR-regulated permease PerM
VLLAAMLALLAGFCLYVTRPVVVPVLFALFLAVLVEPPVARLSRKLPHWLSLALVLLGVTIAAAVSAVVLVMSVREFVAKTPYYSARFEKLLSEAVRFAKSLGVETGLGFGVEENLSRVIDFAGRGITSVLGILGEVLVIVVLAIFALLEASVYREKLARAFGPGQGASVLEFLDPLAKSVGQYLRTKTVISLATGLVFYLVALAIGIDFAFLWGALVFLLNYVPYFGPVVAAVPAVAVAFLQYDTMTRGIIALFALGAVQVTSGVVVEPLIMGRSLRISPLFVLVSMLFWGWMWGIAGVVLAIPLSAALVMACAHIEELRPVAVILGARLPEAAARPGTS